VGSLKNRVCVLSTLDVKEYQETGIRPSCMHHEHISMDLAKELTGDLLYTKEVAVGASLSCTKYVYEFDWVRPIPSDNFVRKLQAIVPTNPLHWVIRKSGGMDVHQLVRS